MAKLHPIPFSYLQHLQDVYYRKNEIDHQQAEQLLAHFRQLRNVPFAFMPTFYMIDYTTQAYILMSEGVKSTVQYCPEEFMEGGIELLIHIFQKDDFRVFNEQIFTCNKAFLKTIPADEHHDYIFNYTFRVKNGKGGTTQVYQSCNYLTDPTGQPLYSLGIVNNIPGLINERIRFHSIEKKAERPEDRQIIQQNYFYPYQEDTLLTHTEKIVAAMITEGLSIKMISAKLHLSENTIANHRKNMMRKTNTKNVAEFVAFVVRNHII